MWPLNYLFKPEFGVVLALLIGFLVFNPIQEDKAVDTHFEQTTADNVAAKINIEDDNAMLWLLESSHDDVWKDDLNKDFVYSREELQAMAKYWPSTCPSFNSFNDANIREQIRGNVLRICDKLLALAGVNKNLSDSRRIEDIKHIQNLYANQEIWSTRQIPKYYHATRTSLFEIMNSTHIQYVKDRELNPAAWFASGFFLSQFIFSFSSDLELPIEDITASSHYLNGSMNDCYCIGRKSDIVFYNGSTTLVSWAVPHLSWKRALNFVNNLPKDLAEFYLSRSQTNVQMILERQMISLAQIYSTDRANSVLMGALRIKFNVTQVTRETVADLHPGELLLCKGHRYAIYSHQAGKRVAVIIVLPAFRTYATTTLIPIMCDRTMQYIPDMNMDAMQFMQVLADGQLLSDPVRQYKAFNFTIEHEYDPKGDDKMVSK